MPLEALKELKDYLGLTRHRDDAAYDIMKQKDVGLIEAGTRVVVEEAHTQREYVADNTYRCAWDDLRTLGDVDRKAIIWVNHHSMRTEVCAPSRRTQITWTTC